MILTLSLFDVFCRSVNMSKEGMLTPPKHSNDLLPKSEPVHSSFAVDRVSSLETVMQF